MDLPELIKTCMTEQRAFDYLIGSVHEVVDDVKGDTLLHLTLKRVKRGSLVYTDQFRSYDGLVNYGFKHERINHGLKFANGKV